jgi:phosphoesterase RecJ-like protein
VIRLTIKKVNFMTSNQKDNIKKFIEALDSSKNIALFTHKDPDGDAVGSISSMHYFVESLGKKVTSFLYGDLAGNFSHMVLPFFTRDNDSYDFDMAIVMDCAELSRAGLFEDTFVNDNINIVNIDHHPQDELFGDFNIVNSNSSSTSEIIYEIFLEANFTMNKDIASFILMGIMSDTGNFMHTNTSPKTLNIASDLLLRGADIGKISRKVIRQKRISTLKLWGSVLSRIKSDRRQGIVSSVITNKDLEACGATKEELEGVVNLIASIPNSKASLLLREDNEGNVRGSLRSNTDEFDTRKFAKIFGGGGHTRASGFKLKGKLKEADGGWQIVEE